MDEASLHLEYDDELTDDEPMIVATYSAHWLPFLLATAQILGSPGIWDPTDDVELATTQARDLLARLMGAGMSYTRLSVSPTYLPGHALLDTADADLVTIDALRWSGSCLRCTAYNDGDEIVQIPIFLGVGTLHIEFTCRTRPVFGYMYWSLHGTDYLITSVFDAYSASGTRNVRTSKTLAVTKAGPYNLRLQVDGKNPSSSDYGFELDSVLLTLIPPA